jgi:AraC-like DNA-binding protein
MHLDRPPGPGFESVVEKFRLLERKGGPGSTHLELAADCHFALGFRISGSGCQAFVGGPSTGAYTACADHEAEYLFVRFRPGRLPRLLDVAPPDLLDGGIRNVARLFGMDVDGLCERLGEAPSLAEKQTLLEDALRPGLARPLCQDRRCVRALELIEACQGSIQVEAVALELGLSPRTLRRMFLEQVGLAPKAFIRHLRFQRTLERLQRSPLGASLAELAQAGGYADQSHLIREFRRLAGRLPTELRPAIVADSSNPGRPGAS